MWLVLTNEGLRVQTIFTVHGVRNGNIAVAITTGVYLVREFSPELKRCFIVGLELATCYPRLTLRLEHDKFGFYGCRN